MVSSALAVRNHRSANPHQQNAPRGGATPHRPSRHPISFRPSPQHIPFKRAPEARGCAETPCAAQRNMGRGRRACHTDERLRRCRLYAPSTWSQSASTKPWDGVDQCPMFRCAAHGVSAQSRAYGTLLRGGGCGEY